MAGRNRNNPLALAVLLCLTERPMHPYEVATTLRQRQKHESVRLNYGSLYAVVGSLERRGLIAAAGDRAGGPAARAHGLRGDGRRAHRGPRLAHRAAVDPGQGVHRRSRRRCRSCRRCRPETSSPCCTSARSASSWRPCSPTRSGPLAEQQGLPRAVLGRGGVPCRAPHGGAGVRPPARPQDRGPGNSGASSGGARSHRPDRDPAQPVLGPSGRPDGAMADTPTKGIDHGQIITTAGPAQDLPLPTGTVEAVRGVSIDVRAARSSASSGPTAPARRRRCAC